MSQRKKPAKRPTPDPLGGPEELSAEARADQEAKAKKDLGYEVQHELRPHKIVGQLIGARYNAGNEIIGEEVMGEVAIFRAQFAEVPKLIEEGLAAAKEQAEAEEAGLRHKAGR